MSVELTDTCPEATAGAAFAQAMSRLAGGVAVVTCAVDGRPWGATVTAVASVSAAPPTVLVSLATGSATARAIAEGDRFGISVLGEGQVAVARHASAPGAAKFLDRFVEPAEEASASPMVAGALAHLDCELVEELVIADHVVFFGLVLQARTGAGGRPLVYFSRAYRALADLHTPTD